MGISVRRVEVGSVRVSRPKSVDVNARRIAGVLAAVSVTSVVMVSMGGCYKKVVGARGLGADQYTIEQPDYEGNSWLDRNIFGTSPSRTERRGSRLQ
jgi:hypothetical protein